MADFRSDFRVCFRRLALLLFAVLLTACGGRGEMRDGDEEGMSAEAFQRSQESQERVQELNEQLLLMAVESGDGNDVYRVGPEDRLRVEVFNVDELTSEVRVSGSGRVQLPLIGEIRVSGLTLSEVEQVIADAYADGYIRNPQVSAHVIEYRSQQFTLIGAVQEPKVYAVQRKTSLVEALAMGGGLNQHAGRDVYLRDRIRDPDTGEMATRSLVVPIEDLMRNAAEMNVVLGESALINVPRAGMVYVEGSVSKPGVYPQHAGTTILKAIAQAGGLEFEANKSRIKVVRRDTEAGDWNEQYYDIASLRESPENDVTLSDGDVVVVESSGLKTAFRESTRWVTAFMIILF